MLSNLKKSLFCAALLQLCCGMDDVNSSTKRAQHHGGGGIFVDRRLDVPASGNSVRPPIGAKKRTIARSWYGDEQRDIDERGEKKDGRGVTLFCYPTRGVLRVRVRVYPNLVIYSSVKKLG